MKLGPVTKLEETTKTTSKKIDYDVMSEIVTSFLFSVCFANSEHSRGLILDTESAEVMFSVILTFFLTKNESRAKKPLTKALTLLL